MTTSACGDRERGHLRVDEHGRVRVEDALEQLGGVADRRSLLGCCSRRALDTAVARGSVVRIARSIYALPVVDQARIAAAEVRGVVSHLSAALSHGWNVKTPPRLPHVTVRRNRSRLVASGIRIAWGDISDADLAAGVTGPIRTVIDCARVLPFDEALAVADSALRSGKVRQDELQAAALAAPRTGRASVLRVVRCASGEAANPFESVLRAIALDVPGLHAVPQGAVAGVGRADLTDRALRIAIEAESFEFHALPEAFKYDVRRYTAMVRAGWIVVRFVWEDVMHRPAYVRGVLADAVALRAGRQVVQRGLA